MAEEKQISEQDLRMWVEFITFGKVEGKEPSEKQIKQLERLSKRTVNLADASTVAQYLVRLETQSDINNLTAMLDSVFFILRDKINVTPEEIERALDEREKEIQEQFKEDQEATEKEENSDEKVVQFKKDDK